MKNTYQLAIETARELRKKQTDTEIILWKMLRNKKMMGYKFLRQHPVFINQDGHLRFLIIDFYCSKLKLGIEIDGEVHNFQRGYDNIRDIVLNDMGIRIIRINNESVLSGKYLYKKISDAISNRI